MSIATTALDGRYAADTVHSTFGFSVLYQGVSNFRGSMTEVAASLRDGRLEGVAQVESISVRTPEQFRAHLLSEEFFDAANHPEITFTSSRIDLRDDASVDVDGVLTIKGITNPVRAGGTWQPPSPDAFGSTRAHLKLDAVVDRTDFDMRWNVPLPSGGNALANEITITVELALVDES